MHHWRRAPIADYAPVGPIRLAALSSCCGGPSRRVMVTATAETPNSPFFLVRPCSPCVRPWRGAGRLFRRRAPSAPSRGELPEQRAGFLCSRLTAGPRILGRSVLADWAQDERDGVSPAVLLTGDLVADLGSSGAPDLGRPLQPEDEEEWLPSPKVRGRMLALVPLETLWSLPGGRRESRRRSNDRAGARDWYKFGSEQAKVVVILELHSLDRDRLLAAPDAVPRHSFDPVGQAGVDRSLATAGKSEWTGTGARAAAEDEDQTHDEGRQGRRR